MVSKCVVCGCNSEWYPQCDLKFHLFPKDVARRNKWLSILPLKSKFYESAKICSHHFKVPDYVGKFLSPTACPFYIDNTNNPNKIEELRCIAESAPNVVSPIISSVHSQVSTTFGDGNVMPVTNLAFPSGSNIPIPTAIFLKEQYNIDEVTDKRTPLIKKRMLDITTQVDLRTDREKKLSNTYKVLVQKLNRQRKTMKNLQALLAVVKNYTARPEIENIVKGNFADICKLFKKSNTPPQGVRYSDDVKAFALTVHFYSPKAYSLLRKYLCLPQPLTF